MRPYEHETNGFDKLLIDYANDTNYANERYQLCQRQVRAHTSVYVLLHCVIVVMSCLLLQTGSSAFVAFIDVCHYWL
jgi:hypothetical protein